MVEEAGGSVQDGSGKPLIFNRQELRHRGIVASNNALTPKLQGMLAEALSANR
jgi:3'-phosphoadenosine 5'-phosphosulfate (PAPS) 3'-phosphatase